jgi:hypothetical protein
MKFVLNDSKVRAACVEHILNVDVSKKPIMMVNIDKFSKLRTLAQNNYYWGVVLKTIVDEQGLDQAGDEELHEAFGDTFLVIETKDLHGLTLKKKISTTKLPSFHRDPLRPEVPSFFEYCEWICQYAAENMFIAIPFPNQKDFDV